AFVPADPQRRQRRLNDEADARVRRDHLLDDAVLAYDADLAILRLLLAVLVALVSLVDARDGPRYKRDPADRGLPREAPRSLARVERWPRRRLPPTFRDSAFQRALLIHR